MGEGLRRVAKQCGGMKAVERDGTTIHYDADGKVVKITELERPMDGDYRNLTHWRGRPIAEMSREELIKVVVEMGNLMQRFESSAQAFKRLHELRRAGAADAAGASESK